LEVDAVGAEFLKKRFFDETRETDLVEIKEDAAKEENANPNGHAGTPKIDSADAPEPRF
jgi:hypothetical protein